METIETKNLLTGGKLIGSVKPESYHGNTAKRGQPDFVMSRGELMEFNRCPSRWMNGFESEETRSMEWGSLIDCLVLTPERFKDAFVVTPETYPATPKRKDDPIEQKPWSRNATFCKEWEENQVGKQIVKPDLLTQAQNAVKFLFGDPKIAKLINCSQKQVMAIAEYQDEKTGIVVPLKMLADLVPDSGSSYGQSLADLKTCATAMPFPWVKAVSQHDYDAQAALYLDVYESATGDKRIEFLHVLQESFAPWQVGRRLLSTEYVELGRLKYLTALKRYAACLKSNTWPGFDDSKERGVLNGWRLVEPLPYMVGQ